MIAEVVEDPRVSVWAHVAELRHRIVRGLVALGAACVAVYPVTGRAIDWLARPLGQLTFRRPLEAFDTRMLLAFYFGTFLALPLLVGEAMAFAGPVVSPSARRLLLRAFPAAYFLFVMGAGLALLVVLPPATAFFLSFGGASLRPLISVEEYVAFAARLALSFGLAFQTPLVMFALKKLGLATASSLASRRREVYLLAFVLGAVLTSPEVLTQISLAIPLIALYELGLLLCR